MRLVYKRDRTYTRLACKRIDFRRELYTKGLVLDESDIQKDRFQTRIGYKRIGFRREWYTKG